MKKHLMAALSVGASIVAAVVAAELAMGFYLAPRSTTRCEDCHANQLHTDIGYRNKESVTHQPTYYCDDESVCFNVTYRYDASGRRVVPNQKTSEHHVLLFGGSYAFGYGLEAEDSLPGQVQRMSNKTIYNYGLNGAGASFTAAILESGRVRDEVPQDKGVAFFIAADFQKRRGLITTDYTWLWKAPYYGYDESGSLSLLGLQRDVHPSVVSLFKAFRIARDKLDILRPAHLVYPIRSDDQMRQLMVDTLSIAKESYEQQFDGEFIVVLHPMHDSDRLQGNLSRRGLKHITYELRDLGVEQQEICKCDDHPSAALNGLLSKEMAKTIHELLP